MQPKVSMVVPCYNKVLYIGEFFQSVYNQKWDNIELILVNDGSTDGTRDVISAWEPKLKSRGFSVRIIDQSNAGVTAAIRTGLDFVSGDYFCIPDCDDILNPEYVSKMAAVLIKNNNVARVVCDCDKYSWVFDNSIGLKSSICTTLLDCDINLVNANFMGRISHSICLCMVRAIYLSQLIKSFQVDFRESQEPQSCLVFGYIGNTWYLPENLYFYRKDVISGINESLNRGFNILSDHLKEYYTVGKKAVMLLQVDNLTRNEMLNIADIGCSFALMLYRYKYDQPECSGPADILEALSKLQIPFKRTCFNLDNGKWRALNRSVSNYLIGYSNPFHGGHYKPNPNGRIIGYGAYGVVAQYFIPLVLDTPLKPDVLWDRADGRSAINGIPITKPNVSSLTPDDTVLVFMRNRKIAAEVCDLLTASATDNILYYYDILDYLADFYFPLQLD